MATVLKNERPVDITRYLGRKELHELLTAERRRLGKIIHKLERTLAKRNRKSARQHRVLSDYKRADYRVSQMMVRALGLNPKRLP